MNVQTIRISARVKKIFILPFVLFATPGILNAQKDFTSVDSVLTAGYKQNQFSGTVIIAKEGKIQFERSYGYADWEKQVPFTTKTTFQIASLSKQFTAFGIMLLKARGQLRYDDPVASYLTSFPYPAITIRHLLHHTSGLPDFWTAIRPHLNHQVPNGNQEMLQYLIDKKLPLQSEPGSKWHYADIGYDLLAMVIEKVSGNSFEQFMDKHIFKPAGMRNTMASMYTDMEKLRLRHLAMGHEYIADSGRFLKAHLLKKNDFVFYLGNFYGDGSVISSARDLLTWDHILSTNKLLSSTEFEQALTPARDPKDSLIYTHPNRDLKRLYGFGWMLGEDPVLGPMYYHGGGHPGFATYYIKYPKEQLLIIFLSNTSSPGTSRVRGALIDAVQQLYKALRK